MPRSSSRPFLYCSPIMRFCHDINAQEPDQRPPLWSMLVYMLLTETFDVSDAVLLQQLGLRVPSDDALLGELDAIHESQEDQRQAGPGQTHSDILVEVGWQFSVFLSHGTDDASRLQITCSFKRSIPSRSPSRASARLDSQPAGERKDSLSYISTATSVGDGPLCTRQAGRTSSSSLAEWPGKIEPRQNDSSGTRRLHTTSWRVCAAGLFLAVMENMNGMEDGRSSCPTRDSHWRISGWSSRRWGS